MKMFSTTREATFFELTHAQFDSYLRHIFAGSFSFRKIVSQNSLYFYAAPSKKFASSENDCFASLQM